jgi:DNA-binding Lrp family transcriptional regulator
VSLMARAFVLIEAAVGKTVDVVTALKAVTGVNSADPVTGPYDVIAVIEGVDINAVGNLVTKKVHTINGVLRTVTCFAMELTS